MKIIGFLTVLTVFICSCGSSTDSSETTSTSNEQAPSTDQVEVMMANIIIDTIGVKGMTCTGCEETVNSGIAAIEGISKVEASHVKEHVVVAYEDGKVTQEQIKQRVIASGYKVTD